MAAALGIEQLKRVSTRIDHLKTIYQIYNDAFEDIPFIKMVPVKVGEGAVPLYAEAICDERDALIRYLNSQGVDCRPFLPNVSCAPYISNNNSFARSEYFQDNGLTLPCGPSQPLDNIARVIDLIKRFKN
jgi:dTDP-4-amino-4,6-dideoxygalactose transaminase